MSIDFDWLEKDILKRELTSSERDALQCVQVTSYKRWDKIMEQGQPGGTLYLLRSGTASAEDKNEDGDRLHLTNLIVGDSFGVLTFLNAEPTMAEIIAQGDCVVYSLARDDFSKLMQNNQAIAYAILIHMLDHQSQIITNMRSKLLPMLWKLKKKADSLPLFIKLLPIFFIIAYVLAFFYISWKDFSY